MGHDRSDPLQRFLYPPRASGRQYTAPNHHRMDCLREPPHSLRIEHTCQPSQLRSLPCILDRTICWTWSVRGPGPCAVGQLGAGIGSCSVLCLHGGTFQVRIQTRVAKESRRSCGQRDQEIQGGAGTEWKWKCQEWKGELGLHSIQLARKQLARSQQTEIQRWSLEKPGERQLRGEINGQDTKSIRREEVCSEKPSHFFTCLRVSSILLCNAIR